VTRLLPLMLLAACAAAPEDKVVPVVTQVPVKEYVKCQATMPEEPLWVTKLATPAADIFEQSGVLRAQIVQHEGYEAQLKKSLEACLGPDAPTNPKGAVQ
jgi:hypothetical protein